MITHINEVLAMLLYDFIEVNSLELEYIDIFIYPIKYMSFEYLKKI